jgi:hypothetical protein
VTGEERKNRTEKKDIRKEQKFNLFSFFFSMLFIAKLIFSVLFSILLHQQTIKENFSLFVGFAIFSLILLHHKRRVKN